MKTSKSKKKSKPPLQKVVAPLTLKTSLLCVTGFNDPLEKHLHQYLEDYIKRNQAARTLAAGLRVVGVGFRPVVDHMTFRTLDVDKRAKEFLDWGYDYDRTLGVIEYDSWWAKVYRKHGYPVIFIDQAYAGRRGQKSLIPNWVKEFGDKTPHHVSIKVDDLEQAVFYLEKQGIHFAGSIMGDRNSDLRQIFTVPEMVGGKAFTVLELAERHRGYAGFLPPQADRLMESSRTQ